MPQHTPRIAPPAWPIIAERARYESLRDRSAGYGVGHGTIRAIVGRVRLAHGEPARGAA